MNMKTYHKIYYIEMSLYEFFNFSALKLKNKNAIFGSLKDMRVF